MKKLFLSITILLLFAGYYKASAQTYEVPKNYVLNTKEDYTKYEDDAIKTADWLQQTSWVEQSEKRKQAEEFLMNWIGSNSPITISYGTDGLMKYTGKNFELMIAYIGGFIKYSLQHKSDSGNTKCELAGIKAMIDKYNTDPGRVKDSAMEKLTKIDKENKLDEWLKTDFERK